MDEIAVEERRSLRVDFYNDFLTKYSYSAERFKYLQKTIDFLKTKGPVFLVRMPLHHDILYIDNKLDPEFDIRMNLLSKQNGIPYFDFNDSNTHWVFKDGLHMTPESAKELSEELANKILLSTN
jgi:lysophospholipase L1-like esterase